MNRELVNDFLDKSQLKHGDYDLYKFAELIINECIVACNTNQVYGTLLAEDRIRKHFGLEV